MPVRTLLCCALGLLPVAVQAASAAFMELRNEATLARGFGLPAVGKSQLVEDRRLRLSLDLSNEYHANQSGDEAVLLDGEVARMALRYQHRLGERFELGLELPLLHQGGGFLDAAIENWHDWFSLPEGGRGDAPQDRYHYHYEQGGETLLEVEQGGTRIGEVQLLGGWAMSADTALRASIKLPTGDAEALAGNEALGAALWLDHGWQRGSLGAYLSGGALHVADGEVLAGKQRNWVAFGGAGLAWQTWPRLRLIAQLNAHSPLYQEVDEDALSRPGLQLALGAAVRLGAGSELLLGFQEDPVVAASPDFSLHLAWVLE